MPDLTTTQPQITNIDLLQFFNQLLGAIDGGQVLDIATGPGGFINILKTCLRSYDQITGIDLEASLLDKAREAHPEEKISFQEMDAAKMSYSNGCFDLVSCAFSLHHMPDVPAVLAEIRRVLRPGGYCLIVEMYQDHLTEAQTTEIMVHHFAADIDTALKRTYHNHTYTRQEIIDLIQPERWQQADLHDVADLTYDPKGEETLASVQEAIEMVTARAKPLPDFETYRQRGEAMRQRLLETGAHVSNRLVMLAQR